MRWNYTQDTLLRQALAPISKVLETINGVSWFYAHYKNGAYKDMHGNTSLTRMTFLEVVKFQWRNAGSED